MAGLLRPLSTRSRRATTAQTNGPWSLPRSAFLITYALAQSPFCLSMVTLNTSIFVRREQ
jgi:hypothetical protein